MKRYGYHRTSTREQHLDRGIKEITAYCEQNNLELEKIFTDQQTGKNFNRPRYQVLKEDVLRTGDKAISQISDYLLGLKSEDNDIVEGYVTNGVEGCFVSGSTPSSKENMGRGKESDKRDKVRISSK